MPLNVEVFRADAQTRLLIVAPHPDDETIGTGELIQHVRDAGGQVRVLLLTQGDNNPWPQRWLERRWWIGASARQRWARRRHAEVLQALQDLGVEPSALQPLGWPDMGITQALRERPDDLLAALTAYLESDAPSVIALPALADRHPDHGSAHVLARLALARSGVDTPMLLGYLIHGRTEVGDQVVDLPVSAPMHARKLVALEAHRSQMALSAGRMRRFTDRVERYTRVVDRPAGAGSFTLPWQPAVWWRPWLRLTVADAAGTRTWPWGKAPIERDGDGRYRLQRAADAAGPCFAKLQLDLPSPWIFDHWGWCEL